jgi:YVTN family beta-propeller protein
MHGNVRRRVATVLACGAALASAVVAAAAPQQNARVGRTSDGSIVLPTNQELRPAGVHVEFPGRPNAVAVRPGGQSAAVLTDQAPAITVLDLRSGTVIQRFDPRQGDASYAGIAYNSDGTRLYASLSTGKILVTGVAPDGSLSLQSTIQLDTLVGGFALAPDGRRLYAALSETNEIAVVDLMKKKVRARIAVGMAPHSVVLAGNYAIVSNRGGRRPRSGDFTNRSAGSPIVSTRESGTAKSGTVSFVDLTWRRTVAEVEVGLHPNGMAVRWPYAFVALANSDAVSVLDIPTRTVAARIPARPLAGAPFGSSPSSVAVMDDQRIAVTLGRNNAVAVINWTRPSVRSRLEGLIPTGWYPSDVAVDRHNKRLVVANAKGVGSLAPDDGTGAPLVGIGAGGVNVRATRGSASVIGWPTPESLRTGTSVVYKNNGWDTLVRPAQGFPVAPPKAIPDRVGDPSFIKHVFFVIKENRTYDQVLGDDPRGNGDPTKTDFGIAVTPNQHALAAEYVLFDNFYVTGTVSADAHHWLVQGITTDYIEEAFGDFSRSYPYDGGDALAYSPSPFLWEHAQKHGKSVKVYGEFANHTDKKGTRSDIPSLDRVLVRNYPRFNLNVSDRERARLFIEEFDRQIAAKKVPSLSIIQLPMDHTRGLAPGALAPTADVADNDHAFGQIVEAISKSPIWATSAIIALEDDAQFGLDHVDGHRTTLFVASPYARRGVVDSAYYTQLDVLRTIEQILGLPPMNQMDLLGRPMKNAFTDVPIQTEYTALQPLVDPVVNPPIGVLTGIAKQWAEACAKIDFMHPDAAPEQLLNRAIWYANHGFVPYPGDPYVLTPREALALDPPDD